DSLKAYYRRAIAYSKLGDYKQTIRDLDTFINLASKVYFPYNSDTTTLKTEDIGDNLDIELYKPLIISAVYMAYLERSAAYTKLGKFHEAIQDSTKAIEINPKEPKGYNYRAAVYFAQNDFQKAIENFSQGITANPDSYELYGRRGSVYLKIGKNKEAIRDFQQAARLGDQRSQEFLKAKGIKW
ncbi:MAG: tetratricopeptide repeat protein, partial [Nitrospirota bacterium]